MDLTILLTLLIFGILALASRYGQLRLRLPILRALLVFTVLGFLAFGLLIECFFNP